MSPATTRAAATAATSARQDDNIVNEVIQDIEMTDSPDDVSSSGESSHPEGSSVSELISELKEHKRRLVIRKLAAARKLAVMAPTPQQENNQRIYVY
ncbi:hypothetical protein BGX21_008501 [Mortierella sp. AD011]|nr:hypothetical protein BGX20_004801 [Mortierella sp. AD010]KAF9397800.1 hypothetical protein BGX21_008501 [Mortierella sp. AD011]